MLAAASGNGAAVSAPGEGATASKAFHTESCTSISKALQPVIMAQRVHIQTVTQHSTANTRARGACARPPSNNRSTKANLFPKPGGESARVAAEESSRHKTSRQKGQWRANAASLPSVLGLQMHVSLIP